MKLSCNENSIRREDVERINDLLKQLPVEGEISYNYLEAIMASAVVFTIRDYRRSIVGMATLAVVPTLTGRCGIIQDMVVDEDYRGRGLGKELMKGILNKARTLGLDKVISPIMLPGLDNHKSFEIKDYCQVTPCLAA